MSESTKYIGGHVSIAGGLEVAVERAVEIGGNCAQIFSGTPRGWTRKPLDELNIGEFNRRSIASQLGPTFTHALYLINFGSKFKDLQRLSLEAIRYDLCFDSAINGGGVVVHVGSTEATGWETTKDQVATLIDQSLRQTPDNSTFLIENSAGQTGRIGKLEEIRWLIDQVGSTRLGWCLDTCHTYAAGYHLGDPNEIDERCVISEIERLHLWETLKCIHVNDSKKPFNSRLDRHENIGDGCIPTEELTFFLNYPEVQAIPFITETPGIEDKGPDKENVSRIKELYNTRS